MISSQVYLALYIAAGRIGWSNYVKQKEAHLKAGRKASTFRYTPTFEHREIVAAMGDRNMTDHRAMALLHQYETMEQRLADSCV